ncbi:hypothetical protein FB451DRAFT_1088946 [Mycena latifolia]|nr:hypothetical protein FB451DRAFT_1088946 [Mycena latifolia]
MDVLDARLRVLAAERRRVIHSLDSITYPVLTLPPEITAHIFSCYVDNPHIGYTPSPGWGPIVLASVCREWRNICLSVGSLWASIRVYPERLSIWEIENLLDLLRRWLSRAGRQPLDLQVFGTKYTSEIFSAISHHLPQLRTLRLALDAPFSFPTAEIRGRIPCLTKLIVNIMHEPQDDPMMLTAFSDAPGLREAQLYGASLQWISLPWIQLTHLDFSYQTLSACVDVLRQTPNLKVLRVYIAHDQDAGDPLWAPLILPHLHTLKLSYDPYGMLLGHLILPALQTLELTGFKNQNPSLLLQLGLRSEWSLRSVRVTDMSSESAVLCLRSIPSLEAVEIRNEWPERYWKDLITLLAEDDTFLPALRTLTLGGYAVDIVTESLVEMLASRWNGTRQRVSKLASFRLNLYNEPDSVDAVDELRRNLRPLMSEGFDVVLS